MCSQGGFGRLAYPPYNMGAELLVMGNSMLERDREPINCSVHKAEAASVPGWCWRWKILG